MNPQTTINEKPVIGISLRYELHKRHLYLPADYSETVEHAGGIPIHLSLLPQPDYIKNVLQLVDGIVLPGGGDIDPLRYGEEPRTGLGAVSPLRDKNDLLLLAVAEKMKIPVLGICYGMQLLNVFRGGTLIQDIEREKGETLNHQQGDPRDRLSHWVTFSENSLLYSQTSEAKALVNSHHHQAVSRIGENLFVSAVATDGIIEAIEDVRKDRFNLGVQWHPEICYPDDELSRKIFSKFMRAAAERQLQKSII